MMITQPDPAVLDRDARRPDPEPRGRRSVRAAVAGTLAAGVLLGGVLLGVGGTAVADEPPAGPTATASAADHPRWCSRVDAVTDRLTRIATRWQADADTRGSIAWLRERAADATAAGNATRADRLNQRADRHAAALADGTDVAATVREFVADRCG